MICVINSTTGAVEAYFGFEDGRAWNYAWSPDGHYVLVGEYNDDSWDDVYLWKVDPYDLNDYSQFYGPTNIIDADWGTLNPSSVDDGYQSQKPVRIELSLWPSPFTSSCAISASDAEIVKIYDIGGRAVQSLTIESGQGIWTPDHDTRSGIYFIRATAKNGRSATGKVVFLR